MLTSSNFQQHEATNHAVGGENGSEGAGPVPGDITLEIETLRVRQRGQILGSVLSARNVCAICVLQEHRIRTESVLEGDRKLPEVLLRQLEHEAAKETT